MKLHIDQKSRYIYILALQVYLVYLIVVIVIFYLWYDIGEKGIHI